MHSERQLRPSLWKKIAGWACVLIGVAGIVLPIIPGIPFLVLGLGMLATQHRWARALLTWGKRRFRKVWPKGQAVKSEP